MNCSKLRTSSIKIHCLWGFLENNPKASSNPEWQNCLLGFTLSIVSYQKFFMCFTCSSKYSCQYYLGQSYIKSLCDMSLPNNGSFLWWHPTVKCISQETVFTDFLVWKMKRFLFFETLRHFNILLQISAASHDVAKMMKCELWYTVKDTGPVFLYLHHTRKLVKVSICITTLRCVVCHLTPLFSCRQPRFM